MALASLSVSSSRSIARVRSPSGRSQHLQPLIPSSLSLTPTSRLRSLLRASRRVGGYPQDAVVVVPDPRAWVGDLAGDGHEDDDDEEDEEDEDDDGSLDLLARFLHNVFRKISRRARRAVRSVLPTSIPTKLVAFSVNGALILAFLWILKAFLEVVCTLGSMVFVSILLVRGLWSGASYLRESRYNYVNRFDNDDRRWSGVQPAT